MAQAQTATSNGTAPKTRKPKNIFNMPQRLTTDEDIVLRVDDDYIIIGHGEEVEQELALSEYNACRLLRMLAEHLKVTLPAAVVEKIKKAEPREPRKG